ncbi:hypothetical protein NDU88_001174 [Pleurodeles waltl]|uniref:Uncharacterized protein n=1 Tax=Pleurodeles waltl TaxID=8319 RepID=A0AAV7THU8_PLEWA|nr:hypothetical protein NDU88_001174 [Pleurodeles waltl]
MPEWNYWSERPQWPVAAGPEEDSDQQQRRWRNDGAAVSWALAPHMRGGVEPAEEATVEWREELPRERRVSGGAPWCLWLQGPAAPRAAKVMGSHRSCEVGAAAALTSLCSSCSHQGVEEKLPEGRCC